MVNSNDSTTIITTSTRPSTRIITNPYIIEYITRASKTSDIGLILGLAMSLIGVFMIAGILGYFFYAKYYLKVNISPISSNASSIALENEIKIELN